MTQLYSTSAFLLGLILGSFLNVCIWRLPRGESIVAPRSHCPQCGRMISWYDNIPVLSFLFLRGRCRSCERKISPQYPVVELITGGLSLLVYLKFGGGLPYLFYFLLLTAPLVAISFIDLEHKIIPDVISLPGIFAGLTSSLLLSQHGFAEPLLQSLLGMLTGGGILFAISWIYERLRHQEGIGGGDIKLAAMLGAFFGWKGILTILFFSSLLGSLVGVVMVLFSGKNLKLIIPYGPFLASGALIYLFYGKEIIRWYLSLTQFIYN